MNFEVFFKMFGLSELFRALRAGKLLHSGVYEHVSLDTVRPGKMFVAYSAYVACSLVIIV